MTINVALVCRDALILGCDSIASSTKAMIEPWRFVEKDASGNPVVDDQGRYVAKFEIGNYEWVVADVWGGVTKMFELSKVKAKVAATTAGMAALHGRSMNSLGGRTRIGMLTRSTDFRMLNEPEIVHRSTGFPVDL